MPFWSKDDKVRLDSTIDQICLMCLPGERATVKNFFTNWLSNNVGAADAQKIFSATLTTKGHAGVGDEATRARRRALAMLSGTLFLTTQSPKYNSIDSCMSMAAPQVQLKLNGLIDGFRIFALQQEKVNTLLNAELQKLIHTPDTFLQNNLVVCQSYGKPPGGEIDHTFYYDYKNAYFMMWPTPLPGLVAVAPWLKGAGVTVKAANVPEIYWANVPGRGKVATGGGAGTFARIVSTELTGGVDLMVTSAFTGCSFCFKHGVGGTFAAHVSPATAQGDPAIGAQPTLADQLIANGNFEEPASARAGTLRIWGRGRSNVVGVPATGYAVDTTGAASIITRSMFVFGTRHTGTWRIYSQENPPNAASTVTRLL